MPWTEIHRCGQWVIEIDGSNYRIINPGTGGVLQYYSVENGQYGQPLIRPEPDLAVAAPSAVSYVDRDGRSVTPDEKISGFICRDAGGVIVYRVSLTNAKNRGIMWGLTDDGKLTVDGHDFWLYALVRKDRNRIFNYDAYFRAAQPTDPVKLIELEDVI